MSQIVDTAYRVHDILGRFLQAQKDIVHSRWRHLPIPGLFKAVNFDQFTSAFETMAAELSAIRQHSIPPAASTFSAAEEQFSTALRDYCIALERAVRALAAVSAKLARKANTTGSYGWSEYRRDMNEFKGLENEYMEKGHTLNQWFGK